MTKTVARVGEVGLIQRIARRLGRRSRPSVLRGIGDDTAVLRWTSRAHLLLASDMLVEGVHFDRDRVPPRSIGWKALACNVSDVAVMGGLPQYAVVSLGIPPRTPLRFVDELYAGLERCARRFGISIVGGDTVRAPVVVVDVAIVGTVQASRLVLRSGAAVGDRLCVTGRLGGSLVSGRHAAFLPRVREAQWLVKHLTVHAMIDVSDGLAADVWQLARASGVTFRITERAIPVSQAARTCLPVRRHAGGGAGGRRACRCHAWRGRQATWHALMDGEDFELLFTIPARLARRVPRRIGQVPITELGVVTRRGARVELVRGDGRITTLIPQGFRHV